MIKRVYIPKNDIIEEITKVCGEYNDAIIDPNKSNKERNILKINGFETISQLLENYYKDITSQSHNNYTMTTNKHNVAKCDIPCDINIDYAIECFRNQLIKDNISFDQIICDDDAEYLYAYKFTDYNCFKIN